MFKGRYKVVLDKGQSSSLYGLTEQSLLAGWLFALPILAIDARGKDCTE
jgi:hypothetical protein